MKTFNHLVAAIALLGILLSQPALASRRVVNVECRVSDVMGGIGGYYQVYLSGGKKVAKYTPLESVKEPEKTIVTENVRMESLNKEKLNELSAGKRKIFEIMAEEAKVKLDEVSLVNMYVIDESGDGAAAVIFDFKGKPNQRSSLGKSVFLGQLAYRYMCDE